MLKFSSTAWPLPTLLTITTGISPALPWAWPPANCTLGSHSMPFSVTSPKGPVIVAVACLAAAGSAETAPPDERAYPANASGEDAVRQATSVDGRGMSQRVLHRMSRHEKDNRRRRKSLIMMAIGALVLIVAAAILLQL